MSRWASGNQLSAIDRRIQRSSPAFPSGARRRSSWASGTPKAAPPAQPKAIHRTATATARSTPPTPPSPTRAPSNSRKLMESIWREWSPGPSSSTISRTLKGLRELATNGLDKPVLNSFRIFGLLGTTRLPVENAAAIPVAQVETSGVRSQPDIDAHRHQERPGNRDFTHQLPRRRSARSDRRHCHLSIKGIPAEAKRVMVETFRVDSTHSNSFTAWQKMEQPATADGRSISGTRSGRPATDSTDRRSGEMSKATDCTCR